MTNQHWKTSLSSYIWIFNVGRGLAVFIRTALNQGIIYDFGASDEFSPTDFIEKNILPHLDPYKSQKDTDARKIAQAVISHPHSDHISEINVLQKLSPFHPSLLTCPHHKEDKNFPDERIDWNRIKNPEGSEEKLDMYKKLYEKRDLPLQTIEYTSRISVPNLEYGLYYIRPPEAAKLFPNDNQSDNQKYGNSISLILFFRQGTHTLLIPGDITPEGIKHLLNEKTGSEKRYSVFSKSDTQKNPTWHEKTGDQPSLKSLLEEYGLSILVAPHHGLKSCYSDALYENIKGGKPKLVIISEKRHLSETDGEVDGRYQGPEGAEGLTVNIDGEEKLSYSVTTRNGHHILLEFPTGGSPKVYADQDPTKLLEYI